MNASKGPCCTIGCERVGTHKREFTIVSEGLEIPVTVLFCCEHLDLLAADVTPCLDLTVAGEVRAA